MTFREHKKNSCQHIYMCKGQFVTIGHANFFENRSRNIVFMAKIIVNRVNARARQII